ncbi:GspH/FimT family pseudopilin [Ramlibacter sp. USB13]|uniref:Type II secretion system protein H n=1 Tax=Ramlibacter cellulosilyticus TaxID=2764187 RepID=A0A923S9E1_9BURK|nr:GspH/FimT family pseudopilin [Ramlibacter cellulosilyticus]MBC5781659.1 GspH/FimT family pseudopilin [Ramlibacter cellulosilyticus]
MRRTSSTRRGTRQQGFTLVEFIITLVVAAVLLGLAVPGFQKIVSAQRLRAASYNLVSDLVLARSEAVKRRAAVQIVPSASGWGGGWSVQFAGGTLAQRGGLGVAVTSAPAQITFGVDGRVVTTDPAVRIGLEGVSGKRCISLDPSGRPKSVSMECPS